MGHKKIAVLDGGLPNWVSKGFLMEFRMHGPPLVQIIKRRGRCSSMKRPGCRTIIPARGSRPGSFLPDPAPAMEKMLIRELLSIIFRTVEKCENFLEIRVLNFAHSSIKGLSYCTQ